MKRADTAAVCLLIAALFFCAEARDILTEDFNEPKASWSDTLFVHTYVWQWDRYLLDALGAGIGAPSFPKPLPINQGDDQEGRFATDYFGGGSGFGLMANVPSNYFRDVILEGYVGLGIVTPTPMNPPRGGVVVRHVGPAFGANAMSAMVSEDGAGAGFLTIYRWTHGIVGMWAQTRSDSFPAIGTNGCYRLRFGAVSNLFFASLWKVTPGRGKPVETPIDLSIAPGIQPVLSRFDSSLPTGRVGVIAAGMRFNSAFFDDIKVVIEPCADLRLQKRGPPCVRSGDRAMYILTVRNRGRDDAPNVVIQDMLPPALIPREVTPPCVIKGQQVLCVIPSLASGTSISLAIQVQAAGPAGTFTNIATAGSLMRDPHPKNNISRQRVRIISP